MVAPVEKGRDVAQARTELEYRVDPKRAVIAVCETIGASQQLIEELRSAKKEVSFTKAHAPPVCSRRHSRTQAARRIRRFSNRRLTSRLPSLHTCRPS